MYLSIMFRGELYRTDRAWGVYNDNVFKVLHKELEHIVLKDYVIKKRINLWKIQIGLVLKKYHYGIFKVEEAKNNGNIVVALKNYDE